MDTCGDTLTEVIASDQKTVRVLGQQFHFSQDVDGGWSHHRSNLDLLLRAADEDSYWSSSCYIADCMVAALNLGTVLPEHLSRFARNLAPITKGRAPEKSEHYVPAILAMLSVGIPDRIAKFRIPDSINKYEAYAMDILGCWPTHLGFRESIELLLETENAPSIASSYSSAYSLQPYEGDSNGHWISIGKSYCSWLTRWLSMTICDALQHREFCTWDREMLLAWLYNFDAQINNINSTEPAGILEAQLWINVHLSWQSTFRARETDGELPLPVLERMVEMVNEWRLGDSATRKRIGAIMWPAWSSASRVTRGQHGFVQSYINSFYADSEMVYLMYQASAYRPLDPRYVGEKATQEGSTESQNLMTAVRAAPRFAGLTWQVRRIAKELRGNTRYDNWLLLPKEAKQNEVAHHKYFEQHYKHKFQILTEANIQAGNSPDTWEPWVSTIELMCKKEYAMLGNAEELEDDNITTDLFTKLSGSVGEILASSAELNDDQLGRLWIALAPYLLSHLNTDKKMTQVFVSDLLLHRNFDPSKNPAVTVGCAQYPDILLKRIDLPPDILAILIHKYSFPSTPSWVPMQLLNSAKVFLEKRNRNNRLSTKGKEALNLLYQRIEGLQKPDTSLAFDL